MTNIDDQPMPQGNYRPAVRHADVIYVSGMTPRENGKLLYQGKIRAGDPAEMHRHAVQLATSNAVAAAKTCLSIDEEIASILQLTVFLNTEADFTTHSEVADYASDILMETFGIDGVGSRAAVGVATLPAEARLEIVLIASARMARKK